MARGRDRTLATLLWPEIDLGDAASPPRSSNGSTRDARALPADRPARACPQRARTGVGGRSAGLSALVGPRGEGLLDSVKIELHELLGDLITDGHRRAQIINLLATRAGDDRTRRGSGRGPQDRAALPVVRTALRPENHRTAADSAITAVMPIGMPPFLDRLSVTGLERQGEERRTGRPDHRR